ncbi:Sulfite exporter TauE/SafE [Desulforamulus putei DSM 12395]|uniref:Probable membrane transporter protein n=1 Tax=Desulforamulus putei DSM 12395 TaxID=1121429 RepID=A0A1M5A7M5_9FIRM|nr:TSUP family transporter [Desulforamulus putei]SHF25842.1 Sulfite exporter TauE/SafE [Desulforamulus putei DSM 12395]
MTPLEFFIIFVAGIAAGFVNVVGGGGSLIAMPALIFLGLPSAVANGTNRVALMVQSLVAIGYFKNKGYFYPINASGGLLINLKIGLCGA